MMMKKVAVLLSGCGSRDGSEINEAVMALLALDQHQLEYQCFAPEGNQYEVVNHLTGEVMDECRDMLVESARIARGKVLPLSQFHADDFSALVIPGGGGSAKNTFTYFLDGLSMTVLPEVERAIRAIHEQKKPIGAMCIAPVLVAKVLGDVRVTLGSGKCQQALDIVHFGAHHIETQAGGVAVDAEKKIVTTPCFMLNSSLSDIYRGAYAMVDELQKML